MYETLVAQLNELSGSDLYEHWKNAKFPFDFAECKSCLTQHVTNNCTWQQGQHQQMKEELHALGQGQMNVDSGFLRKHLNRLVEIRMKYRSIYETTPAIEETPVPVQEEELVAV